MKPVICKVHGFAVAGGSDIALCADIKIMGHNSQIGYMPTRVWGCPTTAMWVHRLGPEKAKRMMFTGDTINGIEAAEMGLVLKAVPDDDLDAEVEALAGRMGTVPINQLSMQKMGINSAVEEKIHQTQSLTCHAILLSASPRYIWMVMHSVPVVLLQLLLHFVVMWHVHRRLLPQQRQVTVCSR